MKIFPASVSSVSLTFKTRRISSAPQGFYRRLLNQIEEDEAVLDYLHEKSIQEGWKDAVDMVISIES